MLAAAMDNRDCKITITCVQPQEEDGDELYVTVAEADGRASRRPADKKCFDMKAGHAVTVGAREAIRIVLHEADVFTADDDIGEAAFEVGVPSEHDISLKTAKYKVEVRWY